MFQVKHLNIALTSTGVGKSLFMCHVAFKFPNTRFKCIVYNFRNAEERIAERIDANLFDVTIDDLHDMPQQLYDKRLDKLNQKTNVN